MAYDCSDVAQRLADARKSHHEIMTGKAVRKWVDQNGEQMEYGRANIAQLSAYIAQLVAEQGACAGTISGYRGPLRFTFSQR